MNHNNTNWTQEQRLDYLVEQFKADSGEYRNLRTSKDTEGKRRILRSLMNIRMPGEMDESVLAVQDEYLQERIRENGIVKISDIPVIRDGISVWQGDITRLAVDAIHTFAGIQLRAECSRQMKKMRARYGRSYEQPTAVPMLTDAYNLPAKKVVHIVGPIVEYGLTREHEEKLAECYRNTLDMCAENGLRSVAFCCISTGVFHFPGKRAAEIAVQTVTKWLSENEGKMDRVIFNVFKDEDKEYYEQNLL